MEERGIFQPADEATVRRQWAAVGPAAQAVTRELARAMEFERSEYEERVDAAVVRTARDALFASLLCVHVGTMAELEAAIEDHDYAATKQGSPDVENAAWHVSPVTGTIIAATFQSEPDAAVAALRRQAYGQLYRDLLEGTPMDAGEKA